VDQSIADFLVPAVVPALDQDHRNITLRHLLTMTSGLSWDEGAPVAAAMGGGPSYDGLWELALAQPVVDAPGSRVNYNSGAASLLSVILSRATGEETLAWARQVLFDPLGIDSLAWGKDGSFTNGGGGLRLRPRDLARIGALYVNGGVSKGQAIVPANWVVQSITPIAAQGVPYRYGPIEVLGLGFLWWKDDTPVRDAFFAWGYGGQFLYCVPSLKLVVVTTTDVAGLEDFERRDLEKALLDHIVDRVIPSVAR
jgi:CubicO group peptidase (beta-lactamase class C family)